MFQHHVLSWRRKIWVISTFGSEIGVPFHCNAFSLPSLKFFLWKCQFHLVISTTQPDQFESNGPFKPIDIARNLIRSMHN